MIKETKLKEEVWESDRYYHLAKKGSLDANHPGMKVLQEASLNAKNVLDLGCGEGSRLNSLLTRRQSGTGIDISNKALEIGQRNYPKIKFLRADLEKIPLPSGSFDLVYSAYVLEHLTTPTKMLKEAIRLTAPSGKLVFIAPNYGAPNRASPPFKGSRVRKLVIGIMNDFANLIRKRKMNWTKVKPIANSRNYDMDWDTTVEPYLGSLLIYLKSLNMEITNYTSCWQRELPHAKIYQKLFRLLGEWGMYPFNLWGPHLVLVAKRII